MDHPTIVIWNPSVLSRMDDNLCDKHHLSGTFEGRREFSISPRVLPTPLLDDVTFAPLWRLGIGDVVPHTGRCISTSTTSGDANQKFEFCALLSAITPCC